MKSATSAYVLLLAIAAPMLRADGAAPAPASVLRLAGNAQLGDLVGRWTTEFGRLHPDVRIETHLTGSDTGIAALYTGRADLALLGREPTPIEIQAFEWIHRHRFTQVEIATGSLDRPGRSPALVIFVQRDNPLRSITLAQLGELFGAENGPGAAGQATWSLLGMSGDWEGRTIHLYGPDATSGTGRYFRHVVLHDSRMMNWAQLKEFRDSAMSGPGADDAGRQALAALAGDPNGIAVASLGDATDGVHPVSIAGTEGGGPIAATRATVTAREYPLSRAVLACYDRPAGGPTNPLVSEFLDYVLGPSGQQAIAADGTWLPLPSPHAAEDHYGLAADNKIEAQRLVNDIMATHPGLVAAGMHCVPPDGKAQAIIASTLNVIGKPSDPEDILHGATVISPSRKAPKLGIMMPLHDRSGKEIGSLALQFKYGPGEDQVKYLSEATAIRDTVALQIPDLASLFLTTP